MKTIYFSSGRTALYYGLKGLNFKKNDIILLPNIICDEAVVPFRKLGLKFKFYDLKKNLFPDWRHIKNINSKKVKGLFMIHFFGFPNDIHNFINFTKKNNQILIEDYCHGIDGKYRNNNLGQIGDISIISPRKILKIYSGGVLRINNCVSKKFKKNHNLPIKKIPLIKKIIFIIKKNEYFIFLKRYIQNKFDLFPKRKILDNCDSFEKKFIDKNSLDILENKNYNLIKRNIKYKKIYNILKRNKITTIYKYQKNIVPWMIPFYINNKKELFKLKSIQKENNFNIVVWPKLPKEVLKINNGKKNQLKINCIVID
tara:strand:- start:81 stop:1019 length:939 start_codon:yes stop_codon:yes gene_type:complete